MDSFDQVRLKASLRSRSILQAGCDPLQPLAVVEATAKSLELDLIELPSGDPALKGARALYDDQSGAICFEETAAMADRALLIAHELGHAELHAGSASCDSSEIDPSQISQNSPTGIQRVEDYGAKERRELQANVYARELLLPRQLVSDLYLAQGQNSQEIAARTGLPLALVRQQLVDALLLPRPEAQAVPDEAVSGNDGHGDRSAGAADADRPGPDRLETRHRSGGKLAPSGGGKGAMVRTALEDRGLS
jgi:Zn-dependent peptidase ImmA (M78 family)